MKTLLTLPLVLAITIMGCQSPESSTTQEQESVIHDGIRWEGEDDVANHMALRGLEHFMNIEFAALPRGKLGVHKDIVGLKLK